MNMRHEPKGQAGFTLTDTLVALAVMAVILIPLTAFMLLTIERGGDQGQVADSSSFAQISRFISRDLSVATQVTPPAEPGQSIALGCEPEVGVTAWLRTQTAAQEVIYYVTRDQGDLYSMERRLCRYDETGALDLISTEEVAEGLRDTPAPADPGDPGATPLSAPAIVSCTPRDIGDPDPCTNRVVLRLSGQKSSPVSLEIDPRVDPAETSQLRPRAVITCTPTECGGFRQSDGTFTASFSGALSSAPEPIATYQWRFLRLDETEVLAGISGPTASATGPVDFPCDPVDTAGSWQVDDDGGFCTYWAELTITDESGSVGQARKKVVIRNAEPVVNVTSDVGNPVETFRTNVVQFNTDDTFDPDGGALTFSWDFDDDGVVDSTDPNPSHEYLCDDDLTFDDPEPLCSFNTVLTVSDGAPEDGGVEVVTEIPVEVRNARPQAEICGPGSIDIPGQTIQWVACTTGFDAADDPDWNGDGVRDPDGNTNRDGAAEVPVASYEWILSKVTIAPSGSPDPFIIDPSFEQVTLDGDRAFTSPPLPFGSFLLTLRVTDTDGVTVETQRGIKVNTAPIARARVGKGSPVDYGPNKVFSPRGTTGSSSGTLNPIDAAITLDGSGSYDPDSVERPGAPADPNAVVAEYSWRVWRQGWTAPTTWSTCAQDLGGTSNTVACEIPASDPTAVSVQPQIERLTGAYAAWPAGQYRIALVAIDNNGVESVCGAASPWSGCTQSADPADLAWWVPLKINERPAVNALRFTSPTGINPECAAPATQTGTSAWTVCRAATYTYRTDGWPGTAPSDSDTTGTLTYRWVRPFGLTPVTATAPELTVTLPQPSLPQPQGGIRLEVTDADGGTTVVSRALAIRNHPPRAGIAIGQDTTVHRLGSWTTDNPVADRYVGGLQSVEPDPDGQVVRREWTIERRQTNGSASVPPVVVTFESTRDPVTGTWTCAAPTTVGAISLSTPTSQVDCDRLAFELTGYGRYEVRLREWDNDGDVGVGTNVLLLLRRATPVMRVHGPGGNCFSVAGSPPTASLLPRNGDIVTFTPNSVTSITPCFDGRNSITNNGGEISAYNWSFPDGATRLNMTYPVRFDRCTTWSPGQPLAGCLQFPVTLTVFNEAGFPTSSTVTVRFNAAPEVRVTAGPGQRLKTAPGGLGLRARIPSCADGCTVRLSGADSFDPDGLPDRSGAAPIPTGNYAWTRTGALNATGSVLLSAPGSSALDVQVPAAAGTNWGTRLTVTDDEGSGRGLTVEGVTNRPPDQPTFTSPSLTGNAFIPTGVTAPLRAIVPEGANPSGNPNCSSLTEGTDASSLWEPIAANDYYWTFDQNGVITTVQGVSNVECVFVGTGRTVVSSPPVLFDQANGANVTVTLRVVDSDGDENQRTQAIPVRVPNPDARIVPVTAAPANTPPAQVCQLTGSSAAAGATSDQCSVWSYATGQSVTPRSFTLDGAGSTLANGLPVANYRWQLFNAAAGGTDITGACTNNQAQLACTVPGTAGRYRAELTVWSGPPNGAGLAAQCTAARTDCTTARYYLKQNLPPVIVLTPPASGEARRGVGTTFGCTITDPDSSITSRRWEVTQNGSVILSADNAANCNFTLPVSATTDPITVRVSAVDLEGQPTLETRTLNVINTGPIASFRVTAPGVNCLLTDPSCSFNMPSTVTLNGTASSDADGTIASYCWRTRPPGGIWSGCTGGSTTTLPLTSAGDWDIELTVTDSDGTTSTPVSRSIRANNGPAAVVTATPAGGSSVLVESEWVTNAAPPVAVTLDAAGSTDTDAPITYTWQVAGPGVNVSGTAATQDVTLGVTGVYNVTLTLRDSLGATTQVTRTLRVNRAPTASIAVAKNGVNCSATFQPGCVANPVDVIVATGTGTDSDGSVASAVWDVILPGQSTWTGAGNGQTLDMNALFAAHGVGQYRLRLTVTDNNNGTAVAEAWVLNNPQPTVTLPAGPIEVRRGASFNVTASANDPAPTTGALTYTWRVTQGGNTIIGPLVSFSPSYSAFVPISASLGAAQVEVTVTDADGGTVVATPTPLTILNSPPSAQLSSNPQSTLVTGNTGTWTFASASSDVDGAIAWIGWEIEDGTGVIFSTPTDEPTAQIDYTFTGYGDYTVRLLVRDNDNELVTRTVEVRLNEQPTALIAAVASPVAPLDPIEFDGSGSSDDSGVVADGYLWEVLTTGGQPADADIDTDAISADRPLITFNQLGTFRVRLTVFDDDGAQSAPVEVQVTVVNP
jgi:hypothetical protein